MREGTFQRELLISLNAAGGPFRAWRQNAGKFRVVDRQGTRWVQGAPKGAGDIVGYVRGTGRLFELELKAADGRMRPEQVKRMDSLNRDGACSTMLRVDPRLSLDENVAVALDIVGTVTCL